jgi:hypothetical protein
MLDHNAGRVSLAASVRRLRAEDAKQEATQPGKATLVTDAAPLATRARTQGVVDLGIVLAGAGGGLSSGLIVTATSYATLTVAGGLLALVIIPVAAAARAAPTTQA